MAEALGAILVECQVHEEMDMRGFNQRLGNTSPRGGGKEFGRDIICLTWQVE
jgi:hypothetical protein